MRLIPLPSGDAAIVDDSDYEQLSRFSWRRNTNGYVVRNKPRDADGRRGTAFMHREILGLSASDPDVDHRNRNRLDNRRENLRRATEAENRVNSAKQAGCSSRFKGVTWHRQMGRWQSALMADGRCAYLGLYADEVAAAKAYDAAALARFGQFAHLNFRTEIAP